MWRATMEFVHVAVAVLGLLSVGHSAPVTNCETLTQPLELQREQLLGKWIFLAESTDIPGTQLLTKMFMNNAWWKITTANENDGLNAVYFYKMANLCFTLSANFTLVNNTISAVQPYATSATLLKTGCPDCLVSFGKHTIGGSTYTTLQLMSRRSKVTDAELDEFKKQAECLNLHSPAFLDPEKGLCSDDSSTQESGSTDLTNAMNSMASEAFDTFNSLINSESGVQTLLKLMSSGIAALKNN